MKGKQSFLSRSIRLLCCLLAIVGLFAFVTNHATACPADVAQLNAGYAQQQIVQYAAPLQQQLVYGQQLVAPQAVVVPQYGGALGLSAGLGLNRLGISAFGRPQAIIINRDRGRRGPPRQRGPGNGRAVQRQRSVQRTR